MSVPDGATKVAWPQEARARSVLNVRSPAPENGGDGGNDEMNRIFIVAREVISPWSALLSAPGAGEEEVPDLLQGSPAGVRALPWDVARLADADGLRSLLGGSSPKIHHPLAVPDRGGSRARIRSGGRGSIRPLVRGNQL